MYIIYYLLCITFTEYVHMFCSPFAEKNTISTFSDGGQNLLNTHTSDICNFHRFQRFFSISVGLTEQTEHNV